MTVRTRHLPIVDAVELVPLDGEIAKLERRKLIQANREFLRLLRLAVLSGKETAAGALGRRRRR